MDSQLDGETQKQHTKSISEPLQPVYVLDRVRDQAKPQMKINAKNSQNNTTMVCPEPVENSSNIVGAFSFLSFLKYILTADIY
jgi:hypothetical protein